MPSENNDNDADQPTALMQRDALLGLLDRSSERERERSRPHTVPRERVRSRAATTAELEVVELTSLRDVPRGSSADLDDAEDSVAMSPWLVLAVIAILVATFVAVTQLR